jgi:hypothetical protein
VPRDNRALGNIRDLFWKLRENANICCFLLQVKMFQQIFAFSRSFQWEGPYYSWHWTSLLCLQSTVCTTLTVSTPSRPFLKKYTVLYGLSMVFSLFHHNIKWITMVLRPLFLQRKSRKYHPGNSHFTPFYAVCCPFHSLAASLRRFMPAASLRRFMPVFGLKVKRSSGKKEAREPLSRAYTVLCRFIFPNLTVVFGYVLCTVLSGFLPFSH